MRFKFDVVNGCVSPETASRNQLAAVARGLPFVSPSERSGKRVAVVGGGPSVAFHLDELRAWGGPVWAVNGAWKWLQNHGIEATLFAIHAEPIETFGAGFTVEGCKHALVCTVCDPTLFDVLAAAGAEVTLYPPGLAIATAAVGTLPIAGLIGHDGVKFFGCDSSFGETTHVYLHEPKPEMAWVKCGDDHFLTDPQMLLQAETICQIKKARPRFVDDTGDGLLGAMLRHEGEYAVVEVTPALFEKCVPRSDPYVAAAGQPS